MTLDGPAGAGKTSTAQAVARQLDFRHLDSGALYRALTFALMEEQIPEERWEGLSAHDLDALDVSLAPTPTGFEVRLGRRTLTEELRAPEVTERVSKLARVPAVRECLIGLQREAGAHGRLVADGRDMGTVVFPDAEVKVYLVADLEERARRRLLERSESPDPSGVAAEASAISRRDELDSDRDISPLRRPQGAVEIDTTALSFDEQVAAIVGLVRRLTV